jgi:hypothetical protein
MIREIVIPLLPDTSFKEIGNIGWSISKSRSKAVELEQQARDIVERWIESEGTSNG